MAKSAGGDKSTMRKQGRTTAPGETRGGLRQRDAKGTVAPGGNKSAVRVGGGRRKC